MLEIRNLSVSFKTDEGVVKAVDNVSLTVGRGEVVGLVGESGSGKSVTSLSILRLIASPPGRIEGGEILFSGTDLKETDSEADLLKLDIKALRKIRGRAISMIFQEPMSCLSPLHRIGRQMIEALRIHRKIKKKEAWAFAEMWLQKVRIADAPERMFAYPYQLSGGMQQRIMIAMAMMMEPDLLIADEPTTALDVTIQTQIFELIREMKQSRTSILLITHDMGVVWEMCDRVLVMYAAKIVEEGSLEDIFFHPSHPYTRGLLKSIPKLSGVSGRLSAIPGQGPSPFRYPSGCRFRDRCVHAFDRCKREEPTLRELKNGHRAACFLADQFVDVSI